MLKFLTALQPLLVSRKVHSQLGVSPPCNTLFFMSSEKYGGICRHDIVVGDILGEGFFGEVHNGIYTNPVS